MSEIEELKKQRLQLKDKIAILKKSQDSSTLVNLENNESKM